MYDELIKKLRVEPFEIESSGLAKVMNDAADALEQLQADNADLENRIGHQNVTIAELYKTIEKLTKENQTK